MDIGVQLFSLKNYFVRDQAETLARLARIGYDGVELPLDLTGGDSFGLGDVDAKTMTDHLAAHNMRLIATHLHLTTGDDDQVARAIDFNQATGCTNAVIPLELIDNAKQAYALAERLDRLSDTFRKAGIALFYHNHFQEFQRFDGCSAYDILMAATDPEKVKFEVDTYWAARGGADVVELLHRLGRRCGLIHQKDMPASLDPVNILGAMPPGGRIGLDTIGSFIQPALFTEIGNGVMPLAEIVKCARDHCHADAIIVELDATARDEMESVEISYRNLVRCMADVD
jgi:sugar phosphate isomerase/epimerase